MSGNLTLESLRDAYEANEIDTVLACFPDMQGRLVGKRFHAEFFLNNAYQETHGCNYLLATDMEMETVEGYKSTSWSAGYGDYVMQPDLATLRRVPWLEATALVLCDVLDHHTHEPIPHAPRTILKRQIARLNQLGMQPMMATELEFFIFKQSYEEVQSQGFRQLAPISAYNEDYHIFQTTKEEHIMRTLRNGLHGAGITVENSKGEASAGQEEINIQYADALLTADQHVITKNACKEIAWQHGQSVTFMAKWDDQAAGSSSHIHQSLWSTESDQPKPLFFDKDAEHGMSTTMQQYIAGLLAHASDVTFFLAPNINSYKRFKAGTFAPTKAIWSFDNRTAAYRLVGENSKAIRIECRVGGADLNPYLAMAAQIAAGIAGIEQRMALQPAFEGDAYQGKAIETIPITLREATKSLDQSKMLRDAFGDAVIDHYVHAARWEQTAYDNAVTDWEKQRGFERG